MYSFKFLLSHIVNSNDRFFFVSTAAAAEAAFTSSTSSVRGKHICSKVIEEEKERNKE